MLSKQLLRQLARLVLFTGVAVSIIAVFAYFFVLPKTPEGVVEPWQLALTGDDTRLTQMYYKEYFTAEGAAEGDAEMSKKLAEFGFEKGFYRVLSEPPGIGVGSVTIRKVMHVVARFSTADGAGKYLGYMRQVYGKPGYSSFDVPNVGDDRFGAMTGKAIDVMGSIVSVLQYAVVFVESNFYEKIEYIGTDPADVNRVRELALKAAGKIS